MNKNWIVPAAIAAIVVACLACFAVIGLVRGGFLNPGYTVVAVQNVPAAIQPSPIVVATVNDGTTDKVVDNGYRKYRLDADWIGDDFDVEHTLPATVVGPANVEVKPFMGQGCFLLRVNEGESFTTDAGGAFWPAGSQGALIERWKHHLEEYLSHYPECTSTYESVEAFLLANPTHR